MPKSFYSWLLAKWLALFILTVFVNPGLLDDIPGPSNTEELKSRKRRVVAYCKNCNFRATSEVSNVSKDLKLNHTF